MKEENLQTVTVRAETYTVLPDDEKIGRATITCNSVSAAAETAKIFFFTPCKVILPGDDHPSFRVDKDGTLKNLSGSIYSNS
tara:strand:- start:343 stop:588 length:246 start_codon:yes stop_codon:yes gene_type:complete